MTAPARQLQPCGTPAAYLRHKRHGEEPCARCRQAHRLYRLRTGRAYRARAPIGRCGGCDRDRPLLQHRWCGSCNTRWYDAGKPESGPPPLPTPEELRAIRCRNAQQGRLSLMLNQAIARGGWEWAV